LPRIQPLKDENLIYQVREFRAFPEVFFLFSAVPDLILSPDGFIFSHEQPGGSPIA